MQRFSFTNTHKSFSTQIQRAALSPFIPQPVFMFGIALTQVPDLVLGFVEIQEVFMDPPLRLVQVPLDDFPSLQCFDHTTQLVIVCELAEDTLNPTVYVTTKDVKYWSQ